MTDTSTRKALAAWREDPSPESLDAAITAHRRADLWLPWDLLSASPRWSRHVEFVREWFTRPLEPEDGLEPELIESREAELGLRLPDSVREWYQLLGGRLELCGGEQRINYLDDLDDSLALAVENQACTCWWAKPNGDPDPPVESDFSAPTTVSAFYLAFLRDELASFGTPPGLTEGVRWAHANLAEFLTPEEHRRARAVLGTYPVLPTIYQASHGDRDAHLVLHGDDGFAFVTRTDAAWEKLRSELDLAWRLFETR